MGVAKTVISVAIIGNAKWLIGAVNKADASMGGLLKTAAKGFVAFKAVDATFDFLQDSTKEADRLGDALARLTTQIGPEFTARLDDTADNFAKIGGSRQDILELEAIFADFSTTLGLTDTEITSLAESAAATALAVSLLDDSGRDASAVLDLIKSAAGGSAKAARELGVTLVEGADGATQMRNILDQLNPRLQLATSGTADLEQKQSEMQARIETLQAKIGEQLNPILVDMLTIISDGIDDIDGAIWGFQQLGAQIERFGRTALGPLGNVRDVLEDITRLLPGFNSAVRSANTLTRNGFSDSRITDAVRRTDTRNGTVTGRIGGP